MAQQKYRKQHHAYVAEGAKLAEEWLLSDVQIELVAALPAWLESHKALTDRHPGAELIPVSPSELASVSTLQTPNQVLVVAPMPAGNFPLPQGRWCIALDTVQDPGNLGTIIRIADWFGIGDVVCSPDCADAFSPKVIQAAMGGHLRVRLHRADLHGFIRQAGLPVIAATLDGENVYRTSRPEQAVLLIGNESKGVDPGLLPLATQRVMIPRYGGAESLNAAVSAGILCALLLPAP